MTLIDASSEFSTKIGRRPAGAGSPGAEARGAGATGVARALDVADALGVMGVVAARGAAGADAGAWAQALAEATPQASQRAAGEASSGRGIRMGDTLGARLEEARKCTVRCLAASANASRLQALPPLAAPGSSGRLPTRNAFRPARARRARKAPHRVGAAA
jgi:hypothetical protein